MTNRRHRITRIIVAFFCMTLLIAGVGRIVTPAYAPVQIRTDLVAPSAEGCEQARHMHPDKPKRSIDPDAAPPEPIFTSEPLPEHIIAQITGVTFHPNTPFPHSHLTYLTITHVGFDGEDHIGHMIVAASIGDEVLDIFREIYESGFPIYSIRLIDYFDACDNLSMAANNSSAFNFRYIANTTTISRHGFGMAIDINPVQNPYVRGGNVLPEAGRAYLDRSDVRPGMIVRGDAVYRAFTSRGWTWGGNWNSLQDYHHFERR